MTSLTTADIIPPQKPKLLDRLRDAIRLRHYSIRTEQAYLQWVRRFIFFHKKRHPDEMERPEVEAFLTHLGNSVGNPVIGDTILNWQLWDRVFDA